MMTRKLAFVVPGPPVPCGRARAAKGYVYTPPATRAYQRVVRLCAQSAMAQSPEWGRWVRPDRNQRFRVTARIYRAARRGDADNYFKSCTDPMNGLVYEDDRMIEEAHVYLYLDKERPRVEVTVETLVGP